jgi:hypothetical protein
MPKLPNREQAVVTQAKVLYLLTPRGEQDKSKYFRRFGFALEAWEHLAAALLRHAEDGEVIETSFEPTATRFVVSGQLRTPDGRNPKMISIWYIDTDKEFPRFITAFKDRRK